MSDIKLPEGMALDDPRPIAAEAPYTFAMPHADELAALKPGDGIKAVFRQTVGDPEYAVERMWVLIESIENGVATGTLDNEPAGIECIMAGDSVRIPLTHVIAANFNGDNPRPQVPPRREYWDRCFVDDCVVAGRSRADYIYREEPDMTREGDTYPDSGWRIRGTDDAVQQDQTDGAKPHYVALGKVLNADDKWLHLIDRDPVCHFRWDDGAQDYIELF